MASNSIIELLKILDAHQHEIRAAGLYPILTLTIDGKKIPNPSAAILKMTVEEFLDLTKGDASLVFSMTAPHGINGGPEGPGNPPGSEGSGLDHQDED